MFLSVMSCGVDAIDIGEFRLIPHDKSLYAVVDT